MNIVKEKSLMRRLIQSLMIFILLTPIVISAETSGDKKLFNQALEELGKGNTDKAIDIFKKVLSKNADHDESRFQLALAYNLSNKNNLALAELAKIKTNPEVIQQVPLLKGNILLEDKNWKEALKNWQNVPKDNPDLQAMRASGLAQSYEGLNKYSDAAVSWIEYQTLLMKPMNEIFEKIAINRVKAGEKTKALDYCLTSDMLKKHKEYQAICKASVYHASGEKNLARAAAEEAVALDKKNMDAKNMLEVVNK